MYEQIFDLRQVGYFQPRWETSHDRQEAERNLEPLVKAEQRIRAEWSRNAAQKALAQAEAKLADTPLVIQRLRSEREALREMGLPPEDEEALAKAEKQILATWGNATVLKALEDAETLRADDPRAAVQRLCSAAETLQKGGSFPKEQGSLTDAQKRIVEDQMKAIRLELAGLQADKKFKDLDALAVRLKKEWEGVLLPDAVKEFNALVEEGARVGVQGEIGEADRLLEKGDLKGAAARLRQAAGEWKSAELWPPAKEALRDARRRVLRARLEVGSEDVARLWADAKSADIDAYLKKLADEWREEARAVGSEAELNRLAEETVTAALKEEMSSVEELLRKDDTAGASEVLRRLAREQAAVIDLAPAVQRRLTELRGRAVKAQLEAARREFRTLLEQDKYGEMDRLRERLEKQWLEEARAISQKDDLEAFLKVCEFFVRVARAAGNDPPR